MSVRAHRECVAVERHRRAAGVPLLGSASKNGALHAAVAGDFAAGCRSCLRSCDGRPSSSNRHDHQLLPCVFGSFLAGAAPVQLGVPGRSHLCSRRDESGQGGARIHRNRRNARPSIRDGADRSTSRGRALSASRAHAVPHPFGEGDSGSFLAMCACESRCPRCSTRLDTARPSPVSGTRSSGSGGRSTSSVHLSNGPGICQGNTGWVAK